MSSPSEKVRELESGVGIVELEAAHLSQESVRSCLSRVRVRELSFSLRGYAGGAQRIADAITAIKGCNILWLCGIATWHSVLETALHHVLVHTAQLTKIQKLVLSHCAPLTKQLMQTLSDSSLKCVRFVGSAADYALLPSTIPYEIEIDTNRVGFQTRPEVTSWSTYHWTNIDVAQCRLKTFEILKLNGAVLKLAEFLSNYHQLEKLCVRGLNSSPALWPLLKANALKELQVDTDYFFGKSAIELLDILGKLTVPCLKVVLYSCEFGASSISNITHLTLSNLTLPGDVIAALIRNQRALVACSLLGITTEPRESMHEVALAIPNTLRELRLKLFSTQQHGFDVFNFLSFPRLLSLTWEVERDVYDAKRKQQLFDALSKNKSLCRVSGKFFADDRYWQELVEVCSAKIVWDLALVSCDGVNHRNRCCIGRTEKAVIALLAARKFRQTRLQAIGRDVVKMIAQELWDLRGDAKSWWNAYRKA